MQAPLHSPMAMAPTGGDQPTYQVVTKELSTQTFLRANTMISLSRQGGVSKKILYALYSNVHPYGLLYDKGNFHKAIYNYVTNELFTSRSKMEMANVIANLEYERATTRRRGRKRTKPEEEIAPDNLPGRLCAYLKAVDTVPFISLLCPEDWLYPATAPANDFHVLAQIDYKKLNGGFLWTREQLQGWEPSTSEDDFCKPGEMPSQTTGGIAGDITAFDAQALYGEAKFSPTSQSHPNALPSLPVVVFESLETITVVASVPFYKPNSLVVEILSSSVSISANIAPPVAVDAVTKCIQEEISDGQFTREVPLPCSVDPSRQYTTCLDSMLSIVLPKRIDIPVRVVL
eukprot:gnl/Trimastix_PCT/2413.p1 GENE.gnl/Trimastix_PCT/2413~~gnl/Trimastix_PCT/2413.p1  ORF type:complete len:345 (-),score=88.28 gnl/Trimastix_PCT/2413:36-1070(-)